MLQVWPTELFAGVEPRVKVLRPKDNVQFSKEFPDQLSFVKDKTFKVSKTSQVHYQLSWILPEDHYKDIDLSNAEASGEKLYPETFDGLYEILIGFKLGNYLTHIYFPADQPIYRLDYYSMVPQISSASLKYLGAIKPSDSPAENRTLKVYALYRLKPIILRIYADDGIDYEKITWDMVINKCKLEAYTPAPGEKVKWIEYIEALKW